MYKDCRVLMLLLGVPWWNKIIIKIVILLLVFYHNYFLQPALQVKIFTWPPFGNQLFWFRKTFSTNQVASFKILGAMATNLVAT